MSIKIVFLFGILIQLYMYNSFVQTASTGFPELIKSHRAGKIETATIMEQSRLKRCANIIVRKVINTGSKSSSIRDLVKPTLSFTMVTASKTWNNFVSSVKSFFKEAKKPSINSVNITDVNATATDMIQTTPMNKTNSYLSSKRVKPTFTLENVKNKTIIRKTRAVPIIPVLSKIGKMVGWGITMIGAGVTTSYANIKKREAQAAKAEERLARKTINCEKNNVGCIQGVCWSNCGPRLSSVDWCFVTKDDKVKPIEMVKCENDSDCKTCWPCATACIVEGATFDLENSGTP